MNKAFLNNSVDDAALYSVQRNHILNQFIFKKNFVYLQKWFHDNYIVLNPGKCYYMTFGLNIVKNKFVLENGITVIPSAEEHVVLGITMIPA